MLISSVVCKQILMDKIMELLVPAETMPSKVKGVFYGPHLGT